MKMVKDMSGNYPDCIVTYCDFEKYIPKYEEMDCGFYFGYNSRRHPTINEQMKQEFSSLIYFNQEQPCAYHSPTEGRMSSDIDGLFTDIYTICPHTADWNNKLHSNGENKFKPILFPIDREYLVHSGEKKWDTVFYGSVCGREHAEAIDIISKFKYKFMTLGYEYWNPNEPLEDIERTASLVTDINLHTFEKWKILSETKVLPIYNQLYLHDDHIKNIKKYDRWSENVAWSHLGEKIAPQLKPRVTEAALFKMLMLVKRDPWNLIEQWFEPDKDFIYFDSNDELGDLIRETTVNMDKYQHIVDSAYEKAYNNYTTEPLFDMIIKNRRIL